MGRVVRANAHTVTANLRSCLWFAVVRSDLVLYVASDCSKEMQQQTGHQAALCATMQCTVSPVPLLYHYRESVGLNDAPLEVT